MSPPPSIWRATTHSYVGQSSSGADAASITVAFSSVNYSRLLVVAVHAEVALAAGTLDISSVTIAGNAATLVGKIANEGGASETVVGLYALRIAAGVSGNIVANFTKTIIRSGIGFYEIPFARSDTAHDVETAQASGTSQSVTVDVPARGTVIAALTLANSVTAVFTGATERYDEDIGAETFGRMAGASAFLMKSEALAVNATFAASDGHCMVAASWR